MKKKSCRRCTKIVRRSKKNLRRTIKRKSFAKGRRRPTRRHSRIQKGGHLFSKLFKKGHKAPAEITLKQIKELCIPPNEDWKRNFANYISLNIGKHSTGCSYDEEAFKHNFSRMYNLWRMLEEDKKYELIEYMTIPQPPFVPDDPERFGEDVIQDFSNPTRSVCPTLWRNILDSFINRDDEDDFYFNKFDEEAKNKKKLQFFDMLQRKYFGDRYDDVIGKIGMSNVSTN